MDHKKIIIDDNKAYFAIRILSEKTGVGTSTLRAWERRYGIIKPERTPKGHRLYNLKDVEKVEYILTLLKEGHSLPDIAKHLKKGLNTYQNLDESDELTGIWMNYVKRNMEAIYDFSTERLEAVYNEVSSLYPIDMVTERLIEPSLRQLGAQWEKRDLGISEEHFYSSWVKNRLSARLHHAQGQATGNRIVLACTPGSYHELGLMLFAISALTRGYRVLYLGSDLPLDQIPRIVERSGCKAVVLSTHTYVDKSLQENLIHLSNSLSIPICLGGMGSNDELPEFESSGGIRLGSNIAVALKVLTSHLPAFSA